MHDIVEKEQSIGTRYDVVTKIRGDAVWDIEGISNTTSLEKVLFSFNRNPECGYGTIDWFVSAPRKHAEVFFNQRFLDCPEDATEFDPACHELKCFGNECMNIYFAKSRGIPFDFLSANQSPMVAHWLGFARSFSELDQLQLKSN